MRLPARAALSVFLSALIVLLLVFFLPPLVVDRAALFGHNRGQALAVADSFAAELEAGGEGRALVESYGRRYPYLDFELLDSSLGVLAASRPGPERYSLGELAGRLGSGWTAREDAQTLVSGAYSGEEERLRYEEIIHAKATYMEGLLEGLLEESRPGGPSSPIVAGPGPSARAWDSDSRRPAPSYGPWAASSGSRRPRAGAVSLSLKFRPRPRGRDSKFMHQ
jgi:hypothetical protein